MNDLPKEEGSWRALYKVTNPQITQIDADQVFICANLRPSADHKALCGTMSRMSEAPLPMREHALDNIRFIRDAMERAGSFTSIPGWGGVAVGVTAIGAAVVAQQFLGKSLRMWLATWLAEAIGAAARGFGAIAVKAGGAGA